jgi:hypothetical protein
MSEFKIDFFELAFLAEACIPPRPIARTMFWQHLTDVYWEQMTKDERRKLFDWLNRDDRYQKSLIAEGETKIFNARFDPDNQYMVYTTMDGKDKSTHTFKWRGLYYTQRNTWISPEFITKVDKI